MLSYVRKRLLIPILLVTTSISFAGNTPTNTEQQHVYMAGVGGTILTYHVYQNHESSVDVQDYVSANEEPSNETGLAP